MDNIDMNGKWVLYFSLIILALSFIIIFGLIGFTIFVRWKMNQEFTFLGGAEFEVFTASAFALLLGLAYMYRPNDLRA